ncbi:MAG: hypothetical protein WCK29_03650 [archaeon]
MMSKGCGNIPFIAQTTDFKDKGVRLNLFLSGSDDYFSGISVNGGFGIYRGKFEGVLLSGLFNIIDGNPSSSLTGLSCSALGNYAESNHNLAVQVGLFNKIDEYTGGKVIQLGLVNRAGDQYSPILNFRGFFNKKSLEEKLE